MGDGVKPMAAWYKPPKSAQLACLSLLLRVQIVTAQRDSLCAVVNPEAAEVCLLQKRESFVGANFLTDTCLNTCWQGSGSVHIEPRPIEAMQLSRRKSELH